MTFDSKFSDYQPVTNPKSSSAALRSGTEENLESEYWSGFSNTSATWEDGERKIPETKTSRVEDESRSKVRVSRPTRASLQKGKELPLESWIRRNGHGLSFIGIFLFTIVVFFRPYEYSPSLSWLSSSAFWIALATLAIFIPTQFGLEGSLTARPREVNLALLLLLTGLLSIPLALDRERAFNGFVDYFKVIIIFIVMVNVVRSQRRLKILWILVLAASCILSYNAIDDYRAGRLGLENIRIKGAIGGLFDNPNDLALHLVTMIPIALALMFSTRNRITKIVYMGCAILLIGGVVATFSRGGFLGLVCAGTVFLWKLARRSRVLVMPLIPIILVLFIVAAPGGYGTRVSTTGDESAVARRDDLKRSIFIASRHPFFGVGMDNYIIFSNHDKATHNAYTQVAAEMGLSAFIFYVLFMLSPLRRLRQIERESLDVKARRRYYYLAICLQASLVGYMVTSFFASVAFLWYIYYLVAYSICVRRLYQLEVEKDATAVSTPARAPSRTPSFAGNTTL